MPVATHTAFEPWSDTLSLKGKSKRQVHEITGAENQFNAPTLVGSSPIMKKLYSVIDRVAPNDSSVLLVGATGTGKELVARSIHDKSPRRNGPFVDINCSAIPEGLIEAELFGHQRGTFTGAHENRCGLFEKASGGTLFLDEVDALNLSAQAKLLRVLQEKTVRRIGARANVAIDVRIISATNSNLAQAVAEGRFRADLYYRLRVLPLQLPELCSRAGDIDLLIDHFLTSKSDLANGSLPQFTPQAIRALNNYPWPGNVRELENAIEYALVINVDDVLDIDDLPFEIAQSQQEGDRSDLKQLLKAYMDDAVPLAEIEKRYILSVLQQFGGNQVRAAAALGIDRSKLYRRLKQYGVMAVKFLQNEEDQHGLQLRSWDAT
jgi:transcriptional regulator with PAS, ATPase and Fis domain